MADYRKPSYRDQIVEALKKPQQYNYPMPEEGQAGDYGEAVMDMNPELLQSARNRLGTNSYLNYGLGRGMQAIGGIGALAGAAHADPLMAGVGGAVFLGGSNSVNDSLEEHDRSKYYDRLMRQREAMSRYGQARQLLNGQEQ